MKTGSNSPYTVTKAFLPNRERLNSYIDQIYETNWLTNFGALQQRLEQRLKEFLGVEHLLLVTNGTLALQIAYRALGLKGEVITTPFSFVATASSLEWEHLTPVFADIDPASLTLDPREVERRVTPATSAIVPVHVYGNACDVNGLAEVADRHGLKLVYDGAHAFGVEFEGRSLLSYGDISTLSFHATKLFHTIEGGAIICKSRAIYDRARDLINFGIKGPDRIEGLGINAKMNEFQAAMGLAVLDEIEEIFARRRIVFDRYLRAFPAELIAPGQRRGSNNAAYFPLLLRSESQTLALRAALEGQGIFTRRYFYPALNSLKFFSRSGPMPVADSVAARILCLPIYPQLNDEDMEFIVRTVNQHLENTK